MASSEGRNRDLFWAIRGGGGNFGVVTSFEFRLHEIADIVGGPTFFPLEGDVLRGYREFIAGAPEEGGYVNFMSADDQDRVRANYGHSHDRLVEIKRRYDSRNLFRLNQNIAP